MRLSVVFGLLLLSSVLLVGCLQDNVVVRPDQAPPAPDSPAVNSTPPEQSVPQPSPAQQEQPPQSPQSSANSSSSQVKEFSVTASQWKFEPSRIEVNKGDRVKLSITSVDVNHGFALPDFNVNANLQPGQVAIVEFTADKTGEFTFFCSVFCGSGHSGMNGKLIVRD